MLRRRTGAVVLVVAVLAVALACVARPRAAAAAEDGAAPADSAGPPASAPAWLGEVTLDGFLTASFSYNFNRPASGTNQLRVFDFDDNTFKLDVFELVAQKPAVNRRDAGFRVDLTVGSSI